MGQEWRYGHELVAGGSLDGSGMRRCVVFGQAPSPPKFFGVPWNVIENKGSKMRKMGQMRIPWNVYENKRLNLSYPGMLLINMMVSSFKMTGVGSPAQGSLDLRRG